MSQREKRAQRARKSSTSVSPSRMWKKYKGPALIIVAVLGAGVVIAGLQGIGPLHDLFLQVSGCTDPAYHSHDTFMVYYPDAQGKPVAVDYKTPEMPNYPGYKYYEFNNGEGRRAPGLTSAVHMHQGGAGAETAGGDQYPMFHFESQGTKCVGLKAALHATDVDIEANSLNVFGPGHAQVQQDVSFTSNSTDSLRLFLQTKPACGPWQWSERSFDSLKNYQMHDGEAALIAFGHYNDTQIQTLEASVHPPPTQVVTACPTPTPAATNGTASGSKSN
jgi:hypothetical protein